MQYYIHILNGEIVGKANVKMLNDGAVNIEVAEDVYNNSDEYIYQDGELVINPDYDTQQQAKKKEEFSNEFFKTSLGYIRRKVTMANGETKDFLSDLLPVISLGVQSGQEVTIITYNEPDFSQELTTEYMESLQEAKTATAEFIQECFLQLSNDFIGG